MSTAKELPDTPPPEAFDAWADDDAYARALDDSLGVSGEGPAYFAEGRTRYTRALAHRFAVAPRTVLDFGCGVGGTSPLLQRLLAASRVHGVDVSARSIQRATRDHGSTRRTFSTVAAPWPADVAADGAFDLATCNGVFHHIPPAERSGAAARVARAVRPGGLFFLFENSPFHPGTRYIMSRCVFDQDAQLVWPTAAMKLQKEAGFDVVAVRTLFVFPRIFSGLRRLEPLFHRLPVGAQYVVVGRRRT